MVSEIERCYAQVFCFVLFHKDWRKNLGRYFRVIFRTRAPFFFRRKTWSLKLKLEIGVESVIEPDSEENIWKKEEQDL